MKTILALMLVASCAFADTSYMEYQMRYNNDLMEKQNDMMKQRMWEQRSHERDIERQFEQAREDALTAQSIRARERNEASEVYTKERCDREFIELTTFMCQNNVMQQYCEKAKQNK